MRRLRSGVLGLLVLVLLGFLAPVIAQSTDQSPAVVTIDKRKLLVQPRNRDGTVQQVSILEDPVLWAREKQQDFYGRMSGALRQMRSGSPFAAAWTLMLLSFGYGVFHAAGPGHGKAVISAWLVATENELRRGVLISLMSAVIQALTAIVLVSVLFLLVASAGATARNVAGVLESLSYGLIALMGLYLIWSALRLSFPPRPAGHFDNFQPLGQSEHHRHGPDCGHAHGPDVAQVKGDWSLAKAFSLALAVGIRPCTGAILVLIFANALGLYWAGVASTFAMAAGTFLTVSVIAGVAVYSRKLALRVASQDDRWLRRLGIGLRLGGGAAITFLGAILFLGSLGTSTAML